jgi:hypothetical protein
MFKKCTSCGHHWATREAFISDPQVKLIGYQVNFDELDTGYFMFNHMKPKCLTTLAIHTVFFRDLYHGEVFDERKTRTIKCPGHCQHSDNLKACPQKCECSFVREVMQIVLQWPKGAAA